jgi:signal peptidase I
MSQPLGVRHLLLALAIPMTVAVGSPVVAATVAQPWHVIGESMEPGIQDGSVLLVDAVGPQVTGYGRGDIVVLSVPEGAARGYPVLVKRIVGLPGDRITIEAGRVAINGIPLREPYLSPVDATEVPGTGWLETIVPKDEVWVMGDHRSNSFDSTAFGPVPIGQLVGRVWCSFDPDGDLALSPASTPASAARP